MRISDSKGFSLIEVMVSLGIFSIVILSFMGVAVWVDKVSGDALKFEGFKVTPASSTSDFDRSLNLGCKKTLENLRIKKATGEILNNTHNVTLKDDDGNALSDLSLGRHDVGGYTVNSITVGEEKSGKRYALHVDKSSKKSIVNLPLKIRITKDGETPSDYEYRYTVGYNYGDSDTSTSDDSIHFCSLTQAPGAIPQCSCDKGILAFRDGDLNCFCPTDWDKVDESELFFIKDKFIYYFPCHPLRLHSSLSKHSDLRIEMDRDNKRYNLFNGSPFQIRLRDSYLTNYFSLPIYFSTCVHSKRDSSGACASTSDMTARASLLHQSFQTGAVTPKYTGDIFYSYHKERVKEDSGSWSYKTAMLDPSSSDGYCATALGGVVPHLFIHPKVEETKSDGTTTDHLGDFSSASGDSHTRGPGIKIFEGTYVAQQNGKISIKIQVPFSYLYDSRCSNNIDLFYNPQINLSLFYNDKLLRTSQLSNLPDSYFNPHWAGYLTATHPTTRGRTYRYKLFARVVVDKSEYEDDSINDDCYEPIDNDVSDDASAFVSKTGGIYSIGAGDDNKKVWKYTGRIWKELTSDAGFGSRTHHTAVIKGDDIYVIGGLKDGVRKNDVWKSSDGVTWTEVTSNGGFDSVSNHVSVVKGDYIYIIGGAISGGVSDKVWRSSNGVTWTEMTASSTSKFEAVKNHAALVKGSDIYVMGGHTADCGTCSASNDVWKSSNNGTTWTKIKEGAEFGSKANHAAVLFGSAMYLIGGHNGYNVASNDVWKSSSNGVTWTKVTDSTPFSGTSRYKIANHLGMNIIQGHKIWSSYNGSTWTEKKDGRRRGSPKPLIYFGSILKDKFLSRGFIELTEMAGFKSE